MSLADFLASHGAEMAALAAEHLVLVATAIAIAVAIGVPLGIALARRPGPAKWVLGLANIGQTVPSLALFGFLIPLNIVLFKVRLLGGIGPGTAIVALVLYALLPILRNTYTGLRGVDPAVREAGKAMGMTPAQLLFQVELPLALGPILAGIRVATVITVGTATIAAAIDAGGLGKYIFRGLRMNDNALILAGAVPAALIAIAADLALGWVERLFSPGQERQRTAKLAVAGAVTAALIAAWLLVPRANSVAAGADRVVIGSKDFTEQVVLSELLAQTIERQTKLPVVRRFDLGGSLAHQAIVAGEIDAYVEYTGTALTAILKEPVLKDPRAVYDRVKQGYGDRFQLAVGSPLGFNNTFAILVRQDQARQYHLKTISDAARYTPSWHAGFGQDFMSRPDGYPGFSQAYGLKFAGRPREMELALTYRALHDGQVDFIAGNSTDGLISRYQLVQLDDDRHYFPPYDAVPIMRRAMLAAHPEVARAIASLSGTLDVDTMRRLNFAVDGEHREAREVVRTYMAERAKRAGN